MRLNAGRGSDVSRVHVAINDMDNVLCPKVPMEIFIIAAATATKATTEKERPENLYPVYSLNKLANEIRSKENQQIGHACIEDTKH